MSDNNEDPKTGVALLDGPVHNPDLVLVRKEQENRRLQLLLPSEAARWQFKFYSKLLSGNIFIQLISYILFGSILTHAIYALVITIRNRRSNGKRYECDRRGVSSKWYPYESSFPSGRRAGV
jgi:hypothetical protein